MLYVLVLSVYKYVYATFVCESLSCKSLSGFSYWLEAPVFCVDFELSLLTNLIEYF